MQINVKWVSEHRDSCHLLALLRREQAVRHGCQPDVGIQSDLMARMAGNHWPATRLCYVANEKAWPTDRAHIFCESLEIGQESRMPPIPIARQPHHLPTRTINGKGDAASEAASCIRPDGPRGAGGRARYRAK